MQILIPDDFSDYELLDSGNGQKLERFGEYILVRPDPQIIWSPSLEPSIWDKADATFERTTADKGRWHKSTALPDRWEMRHGDVKFWIKLSPFKHTGIFPEQAVHWKFIESAIRNQLSANRQTPTPHLPAPTILNLFGYTGIASLVAASAGAHVTHVDASYPTIGWARDNQTLSKLGNEPIRWIEDDVLKFCERELRRGNTYDGIIMDPPAFGHGPKGETWKFNEHFPKLMEVCSQLLSSNPLFVIINAYAISTSAITLENVLQPYMQPFGGNMESGELALQESKSERLLSTGIFTRWSK
jgi:23S rRNA (cytosine1962-C5)-methyltransferase